MASRWGRAAADRLRPLLALLLALLATFARHGRRAARLWNVRIDSRFGSAAAQRLATQRLLERHRDLLDMQKLATFAARFHTPESDFFADPRQVERLIERLLAENPPWLHVSRVLAGAEASSGGAANHEVLWREHVTRKIEDVALFVPEESWRDKPLASLTLRPTRHIEEVWGARLLEQVMPAEVMLDRHTRGEILVPVRHSEKQRLEFRAEQRRVEIVDRRRVPVRIDLEDGGNGGQMLYFLLDYSASMRGKSATLAMAVIATTLRANMGQRNTRYLFRRYAEEMSPPVAEPPIQARTVAEKDALLDEILATNFNGAATHVNDALEVALQDIEALRRNEALEAEVLLVTDGRAEVWERTRERLEAAHVKVHSVMVTPERNLSLESISESFTALDIGPDGTPYQPVLPEGETRHLRV